MKPETLLLTDGEDELDDTDLPSTVSPPNGIVITKEDVSAAKKALKRSGLTTIHIDRIQAKSELGKFMVGLGLFKISATRWVATGEVIESLIEKSVELDALVKEPEARAELLKTQSDLVKSNLELIRIGFKAGAAEMQPQSNNTPGNIPFPANQIIPPISLNINTNGGDVAVKS